MDRLRVKKMGKKEIITHAWLGEGDGDGDGDGDHHGSSNFTFVLDMLYIIY